MIDRLTKSKYGWLAVLILLVLVNWLFSFIHYRADLTAEKRYTVSGATRSMLENLDSEADVTVLLGGDLPAGFRKLAGSTADLLEEFRDISGNKLSYRFEHPGTGLPDSLKGSLIDSLRSLGINATNVKAQTKEGEGEEQQLVYPGAVIRYKDRTIGVDFLQGQNFQAGLSSLNNAESLLEYKLAGSINKIRQDTVPLIGYLAGNGEPLDYSVYDLIEKTLRPNYAFRILPIDSVQAIPNFFKAILIVKPILRFNDSQKIKIDQYVMHGGKLIWMIDNLYASLDSLQRSQGEFIAFDMGLNLEDQLFKYGVRINQDLVQDLQCDKIPSVIGSVGDKPQIQLLPWPYFPLLRNNTGHPIAKNLDYVVSQFPQSIDTVQVKNIKKTVLLSSSPESRILSTPAKVEWASVRNEEDLKTFTNASVPVAVLLEGRFESLFANRLTKAMADSLAAAGQPFLPGSKEDNKMIVVADGDLVINSIDQNEGPLQMGTNMYTKQQYANREFLLNSLEYMVDQSGILETRGKDFTLRLLDKTKYEGSKSFWQILNIVLPALLVMFFIALYQFIRKNKYGRG
ncbi:MAG TPA: gliding motility-associated ABC transporter substrate-binding protein GldG [Chitinophagaceae bacterium]|nr:gliding motility-associated ABC transporter substrate-binding protein GldG [Chitinophagaceae bacterium]